MTDVAERAKLRIEAHAMLASMSRDENGGAMQAGISRVIRYLDALEVAVSEQRATIAAQDRMLEYFGRQEQVRERFEAQGG